MSTFKYNGKKYKYKARLLSCDGKPLNPQIELENLKILDTFMKKYNIQYTMVYGSCLGAVRDKGFIAHDEDCDLGVTEENYNKIFIHIDDLLMMGVEIARFDERGLISFWRNGEYIDIYNFKDRDDNSYISCDMEVVPKTFMDNLKDIKFYDMNVPVPKEAEEYLLYCYGDTWTIPIKYTERKDKAFIAKFNVFVKNILPLKIKMMLWKKKGAKRLIETEKKYKEYLERKRI